MKSNINCRSSRKILIGLALISLFSCELVISSIQPLAEGMIPSAVLSFEGARPTLYNAGRDSSGMAQRTGQDSSKVCLNCGSHASKGFLARSGTSEKSQKGTIEQVYDFFQSIPSDISNFIGWLGSVSTLSSNANLDQPIPDQQGYVVSTLDLDNNTLVQGNFAPSNSTLYPEGIAYDSSNGEVYIVETHNDSIAVMNTTENIVVSTIPVGSDPIWDTYDPYNGEIYVGNCGANSVSVIDGETNKVVTIVPVGSCPEGGTIDPADGYVYVTNINSNSISVIDSSSVLTTIPVATNPCDATFNPLNYELYVGNSGSNTITVINTRTQSIVANITVGTATCGGASDFSNGVVYVANSYPGVSAISGNSDSLISNINVTASPAWATYDPSAGVILVNAYDSGSVSVISDSSNSFVGNVDVGNDPQGLAYDSSNGYVYVANSGSDTVSIVSLGVTISSYQVTFSETGLSVGTNWTVTFNGSAESSTSNSISFLATDYLYSYEVGAVNGYLSSPSSGMVIINGQPVQLLISFSTLYSKPAVIFSDDFSTDQTLNSKLFVVDSAILNETVLQEASFLGAATSLGNPNLPIPFSNQGMDWSMSGAYNLVSGVTSSVPFTPAFSTEINVTIGSFTGANPVFISLSNLETTSFVGIFIGNSILVQNGFVSPKDIHDYINAGDSFTIVMNVSQSLGLNVTVFKSGSRFANYSGELQSSSDEGYYLTLGSFASSLKGETYEPPYDESAYYSTVQVISPMSFNLSIYAEGQQDSSPPIPAYAFVNITNIYSNATYSGYTNNKTGLVIFSNLTEGLYATVASVEQGSHAIMSPLVNVTLGNPSDPQEQNLDIQITIQIPPVPLFSAFLNVVGNQTTGPIGLEETFIAAASGYVGNYSYSWDFNGTNEQDGNETFRQFGAAGIYLVNYTVDSAGYWYGVKEPLETITSNTIQINVENDPIVASLQRIVQQGECACVSISYNGTSNEVVIYIVNRQDMIIANVTDDSTTIPLPSWLENVVGISNAWHGLILNDSTGQVPTNLISQPGGLVTLDNQSLPSDAPDQLQLLPTYKFSFTLDPTAEWAYASDLVIVAFSTIGALGPILGFFHANNNEEDDLLLSELIFNLVEYALQAASQFSIDLVQAKTVSQILGAVGRFAIDFLNETYGLAVVVLPYLVRSILSNAFSPGVIQNLIGQISVSMADRIAELVDWVTAAIPIGALAINLGAIIGSILSGELSQEFEITSAHAQDLVVVDPSTGVAPWVEASVGSSTYGYQGRWVSPNSVFVRAGTVTGLYSFAYPSSNLTNIVVTAPAGVSSTSYNITVYHNGTPVNLLGTVSQGHPMKYSITFSNSGINVASNGSTTQPLQTLDFLIAAAILTSGGISIFFLNRSKIKRKQL